jgi:LPXTG-site transpeptidase (sortase) family protein
MTFTMAVNTGRVRADIVSMVRRWPILVVTLAVASATGLAPVAAQQEGTFALDDPVASFVPSPSRQPAGAAVQALGTLIGTVRIPAIAVDWPMWAGVDLGVLSDGPGHWVGTAAPGGSGNVVIAGHRTTHGAPFGDLDRLQPGDLVLFEGRYGVDIMYSVTETLIVTPDAIWVTYDTGDDIATLIACHPKGSLRQRIVVRAKLVGAGKIA